MQTTCRRLGLQTVCFLEDLLLKKKKKTSVRPIFGADVGSPLLSSANLCPNIKTRFFLLRPKPYHLSIPSPHRRHPPTVRQPPTVVPLPPSHNLPLAAIVNNQKFGGSLPNFGC
ncbi:hypothetical protein HanRHA438_Chr06g0269321 [Helianthus annuus]|nr:hypothetical protein HanRHA438_Chr06g0269321 [Helianthus annuus]